MNLINLNLELKIEMLVNGSVLVVPHTSFLPTALGTGSSSAWYVAVYGFT